MSNVHAVNTATGKPARTTITSQVTALSGSPIAGKTMSAACRRPNAMAP